LNVKKCHGNKSSHFFDFTDFVSKMRTLKLFVVETKNLEMFVIKIKIPLYFLISSTGGNLFPSVNNFLEILGGVQNLVGGRTGWAGYFYFLDSFWDAPTQPTQPNPNPTLPQPAPIIE
jgi:hypothetical protein